MCFVSTCDNTTLFVNFVTCLKWVWLQEESDDSHWAKAVILGIARTNIVMFEDDSDLWAEERPNISWMIRSILSNATKQWIKRDGQIKPLMKLVSKWTMSMRRKDISFRVFSKMIRGSSDWQRRQFGAMTIARLFTSILVLLTFTGWAKTCDERKTGR